MGDHMEARDSWYADSFILANCICCQF